jgi:monolysocardiolipin acyltransferase
MWGILPTNLLLRMPLMRWSIGADEILFKNPSRAYYFGTCGKSISVVRGNGVDQIGVDKALNVLGENGWVHVFSEGRVNQAPEVLSRLKWGVGKLVRWFGVVLRACVV